MCHAPPAKLRLVVHFAVFARLRAGHITRRSTGTNRCAAVAHAWHLRACLIFALGRFFAFRSLSGRQALHRKLCRDDLRGDGAQNMHCTGLVVGIDAIASGWHDADFAPLDAHSGDPRADAVLCGHSRRREANVCECPVLRRTLATAGQLF